MKIELTRKETELLKWVFTYALINNYKEYVAAQRLGDDDQVKRCDNWHKKVKRLETKLLYSEP